jgi:hypothetical protein
VWESVDSVPKPMNVVTMTRRSGIMIWAVVAVAGLTQTVAAEGRFSTKDYTTVSFDFLSSFTIDLTNPDNLEGKTEEEFAASKIPAEVKRLDGKRVCVPAYMLPLAFADGGVTHFLGMANTTSCCYGQEPKLTEIVAMSMAKGATPSLMDSPLFLYGTLKVGPVVQDGYVTAVYSMVCDKVSW